MYRYYLRNCVLMSICIHDKHFAYKHRLEVEEDKKSGMYRLRQLEVFCPVESLL